MQDIIISNPGKFKQKLKKFVEAGHSNFHILSDFDRTLTKAFYKSKKASAIISYLRKDKGRYLTEDYSEKAHILFDKYHPIEINPNIDIKEKKEKMYEWWKKHKELLIESGFNKQLVQQAIKNMISEESLDFRENYLKFFKLLNENNIPLIIMSSSLGDLIEEFIKQKNLLTNNIQVIANIFEFNNKGKAIGIKKIIHVFNKHEMELKTLPIYKELLKRKNVLLLGDSIGDLGMIEGFPYENLIKIGFLNENQEESLELYKKSFDVIITNDSSFDYINELLKKIIS